MFYNDPIYERYVSSLDFLNKKEDDMNWELFFEQYEVHKRWCILLESWVVVEKTPDHISYEVITKSGKKFNALYTFYTKEKANEWFEKSKVIAQMKNSPVIAEFYSKMDIPDNNEICIIIFTDERGNVEITNQVKQDSYELFKAIEETGWDALSTKLTNIQCIVTRVHKEETKRISLYKKIIQKKLWFDKYFEDSVTEKDYVLLFFYR